MDIISRQTEILNSLLQIWREKVMNIQDNNLYDEPVYVYKDGKRYGYLIASIPIVVFWVFLIQSLFKDGVGGFFQVLILLILLITNFLVISNGLVSLFPVYINEKGVLYRSIFFVNKKINWMDVCKIRILKGKVEGGNGYSIVFVGDKNKTKNYWGFHVRKDSNYDEFFKVINFYLKKYSIKATLESEFDGSIKELTEMPKKLDFS